MESVSLQDRWFASGRCFGCGPANEKGLHVRSFPLSEDPSAEVVAEWTPEKHHEAFDNILAGGIVGALLDCHSNWTAAWHLMRRDALPKPPATVTADFHVVMKAPTPTSGPLRLVARAVESKGSQATVEAKIEAAGKVTATCTGHFVAVKPGHPAYGRW